MPASLIVPLLFTEGTFAAYAATLAIHLITTIAISSLINKNVADNPGAAGQTPGGKVQLPPATDNKLPVVYGESWISPIITDVKISADQQTMWYVLAFAEATDYGSISFGDIYWDDKILLFSESNPSQIEGWYDAAGEQRVTGVAGDISMWFYANGSDVEAPHLCRTLSGTGDGYLTSGVPAYNPAVMGDVAINNGPWDSTYQMNGCVFAVVRVKYDQNHAIQGIGQIKALVRNTLGTGFNSTGTVDLTQGPGSAMVDYLMNDRYGCGVTNIDLIDVDAFAELDTWCSEPLELLDTDGNTVSNDFRYQINGYIDTTKDCLSNLVIMADTTDSWVQWNEANGQWSVVINRSLEDAGIMTINTTTVRTVTSDNIIGGINISPIDLNSTYNKISIGFPNGYIYDSSTGQYTNINRGQTDYRYWEVDATQKAPNEPQNNLQFNLPMCDNSVQATWLGYKRLFSSRAGLTINFTMDYSGIQIDAGDIICIKHDWYGWGNKSYGREIYPGKPFRVTQVREMKAADGFLSAQITAVEYNDSIYAITNPHYFTNASFSGLTDPGIIGTPNPPTIPADLIDLENATFVVQADIPEQGNIIGMEFWFSIKGADWKDNNFTLYSTQYYGRDNSGALYPHYFTDPAATIAPVGTVFFEQIKTVNMPPDTYWWRTRAIGFSTASDFSEPGPV